MILQTIIENIIITFCTFYNEATWAWDMFMHSAISKNTENNEYVR